MQGSPIPSVRPQLTTEPDTLAQPQDRVSSLPGDESLAGELLSLTPFYFQGTLEESTSLNLGTRKRKKVSSSEIRGSSALPCCKGLPASAPSSAQPSL